MDITKVRWKDIIVVVTYLCNRTWLQALFDRIISPYITRKPNYRYYANEKEFTL
jgi:hypothetical protein